jgi:hypothetical protein
MMKIIKSAIGMIILAFTSLMLITGSPFQTANNLVENNGHLYIQNIGQEGYAADDNGGGGDDGGGDDGDSGDGDSEDFFSVEDFDDGSGSDGPEESTSASDDGPNNDDGDGVDSTATEFFSDSDEPTSTPPEDVQSTLGTLSTPLEGETKAETPSSSTETGALQDVDIEDAARQTLEHLKSHSFVPVDVEDKQKDTAQKPSNFNQNGENSQIINPIPSGIKTGQTGDKPDNRSQKKVNDNNNNDKDKDWKTVHIHNKVKVINKNKIVVSGYDGTQTNYSS